MLNDMIMENQTRTNFWQSHGYLSGMDYAGQRRELKIVCTMCENIPPFPNKDALSKHMQTQHEGFILFRDMTMDVKKKSARIHLNYRKAVAEERPAQKKILECLCAHLPGEVENRGLHELHDMMADHCSLQQCKKCRLVLRQSFMPLHQKFDCDDERAIRESKNDSNFTSSNYN